MYIGRKTSLLCLTPFDLFTYLNNRFWLWTNGLETRGGQLLPAGRNFSIFLENMNRDTCANSKSWFYYIKSFFYVFSQGNGLAPVCARKRRAILKILVQRLVDYKNTHDFKCKLFRIFWFTHFSVPAWLISAAYNFSFLPQSVIETTYLIGRWI